MDKPDSYLQISLEAPRPTYMQTFHHTFSPNLQLCRCWTCLNILKAKTSKHVTYVLIQLTSDYVLWHKLYFYLGWFWNKFKHIDHKLYSYFNYSQYQRFHYIPNFKGYFTIMELILQIFSWNMPHFKKIWPFSYYPGVNLRSFENLWGQIETLHICFLVDSIKTDCG